jgi:hypothetical protein
MPQPYAGRAAFEAVDGPSVLDDLDTSRGQCRADGF